MLRLLSNRYCYRYVLGFLLGLGLALLGGCMANTSSSTVNSLETAQATVERSLLPNIQVATETVPDAIAARYAVDQLEAPLPQLDEFPLYAAQPDQSGDEVYIEIFSSSEKANIDRQNERWLVEVADAFNNRRVKLSSGQTIQVGIRQIASGTAAQLLSAGTVQPNGYSPSNDLWVAMIQAAGVQTTTVAPRLVPNTAGWVLPRQVYDELAAEGDVNFERLLNAIALGEVTVAYPNPYASSTALNLLYTLYWQAAGHREDGKPLTAAELQSPQVRSVFEEFQSQVLINAAITLDLQELFLRDQSKLQAFPLEYQNYLALREVPGFEDTEFVPFGIAHNNPLIGFSWNSPAQQAALQQFTDFALSAEMQALAQQQGFVETDYLQAGNTPPIPTGEVLLAAQDTWKQQKDSGRTVYMSLVIDTSGSMEGKALQAVQDGLKIAAGQINPGNYVGLVTFDDYPVRRLELAPFDQLQHQKLLATIDRLYADGGTALYDGVIVGLADLLDHRTTDPTGRFYLLLLTDGNVNRGNRFKAVQDVLAYSDVRFYPIAYGDVNQEELAAIANLRESTVKQGNPDNVQSLFQDLFQVNL